MTKRITSGDVIHAAIDVHAATPDGFTVQHVKPFQRNYAAKIVKSMTDAGALFKADIQGRGIHYFLTLQGASNYRTRVGPELSVNKSRFNNGPLKLTT